LECDAGLEMMARMFEDGKRDYRFFMKLFLSLKLPLVDTFGSM